MLAIPIVLAFSLLSCSSPASDDTRPLPVFVDIARQVGIDFVHENGARGAYHYPETFGAGAAWMDVDADGWLDLYLVNSGDVVLGPSPAGANQLWRNLGQHDTAERFVDVTEAFGVGEQGYGMGATSADVNADGQLDIFVTNVGANALLVQRAGHFHPTAAAAGVADSGWATAAAFFDGDLDGDLDLAVVNYVIFDRTDSGDCRHGLVRTYCDPDRYAPAADLLYRNDSDGATVHFSQITQQGGFTGIGRGLGLAVQDVDLDGDADLYVANDGTANLLYSNRAEEVGGMLFEELGLHAGTGFNAEGRAEAGMGTDFGDVDDDGWPDLVVANFSRETNTLYRHLSGRSGFRDDTLPLGLAQASFQPLGFGLAFVDADGDGDLDLAVANGHVLDRAADVDPASRYEQPDQLFINTRGAFVEQSEQLGAAWSEPRVSRALAVGDYDNDGDEDLLVTTNGGQPRLLRNSLDGVNWLSLTLQSNTAGNRQGLGARIAVELPDGRTLHRQLHDGGSYLSGRSRRVHVGLSAATSADVTVHWPGGGVDRWTLAPGAHVLVQGRP